MFVESLFSGIADYMGTTSTVIAMLAASIVLVIILALLSFKARMSGLPLFFTMMVFLGLFVVFEWIPSWVVLFIFFVCVVYLFFGGDIGNRISRK